MATEVGQPVGKPQEHQGFGVVSTKVVCDGPGDQRAENVKAATA
jgi:hypothetical protein